MKFVTSDEITGKITENALKFIEDTENSYHEQIRNVAEKIMINTQSRPIVLLSGPSGSGKTTSALRIEKILTDSGRKAKTISLDNYFLPKDFINNMPLDADGNVDLESPLRLDIELLHSHIDKMIKGEPVEIPVFNFTTQMRDSHILFKREENHIIIFEGIHALNPIIIDKSISEHTTCIYVSVRTRLKCRDGSIVHPRKIRLMRRLIRDKLFRGRQIGDIFGMFKSVSRGEDLYIMPYKKHADFDIDTFLAFEPSAYKPFLLNDLIKARNAGCNMEGGRKIIKFLSEIPELHSDLISDISLVKEFIGGNRLF